ncbi:MAG: MFS transporter [bacterium]|nr:MFS transporter [bacterium]
MPDATTISATHALVGAPAAPHLPAAPDLARRGRLHRLKSWLTHSTDDDASRLELTAYSIGGIGQGLSSGSIEQLAMPILNMTLNVDPAKLGLIRSIKLLWDGINDPLFGHITDNAKTRWGRRRPFIALGGVLVGLMTFGMWLMPLGKTEWWYLMYFGIAIMLIETASTVFTVPYYALGIEMSPTYHGRTRVAAYRSFLGGLAGMLTPWFLVFCTLPVFCGILIGARWLSIGLGTIAIITALFAAKICKERTHVSNAGPREHFFTAVLGCANNSHFWKVTMMYVIMGTAGSLFGQVSGYVSIYYVFHGSIAAGARIGAIAGTLGTILAMCGIPLVAWASKRLGKHGAMRCAVLLMLAGDLLRWVLYNPQYPWLILLSPFTYSIGISATYTILSSMQADVVDVDELQSGRRREGMFGAVSSVVMKASFALATAFSGIILNMTHFDSALGGAQTAQTFFTMRILFSVAPACANALVLFLLYKYPLTAARMDEIRCELQRRRAAKREA